MKKNILGLVLGVLAGAVNIIPLILQKTNVVTLVSTMVLWVVISLFIVVSNANRVKGIIIAVLVSAPTLVYIVNISIVGFVWTLLWMILTTLVITEISNMFNRLHSSKGAKQWRTSIT